MNILKAAGGMLVVGSLVIYSFMSCKMGKQKRGGKAKTAPSFASVEESNPILAGNARDSRFMPDLSAVKHAPVPKPQGTIRPPVSPPAHSEVPTLMRMSCCFEPQQPH
jgi:hypothetical protein